MKDRMKRLLIYVAIIFVSLLVVELVVVRIWDYRAQKSSLGLNVAARNFDNMSEKIESADVAEYAEIVGRELSSEELKQQKLAETHQSLLMYTNIGLAQDYIMPDGSWFVDEDTFFIRITLKKDDKTHYKNMFTLQDPELLEKYRSYWKDNFYSYDKTWKEMKERYRYYQLVFDRFYIDGMTIVPEQVSIYKVERMPIGNADYPEITNCEKMETIQFEVNDTEGLPCYEIKTQIEADNVTDIKYDYSCNGAEGYSIFKDITLNGKIHSMEQRRMLLQEAMDEDYNSRKRDAVGMSNYYYVKSVRDNNILGNDVTVVACEQNILYQAYQYIWKLLLVGVLLQLAMSFGIAGIVMAVKERKKNK